MAAPPFVTLYFQGLGATRQQVQMFTNESHIVLDQDVDAVGAPGAMCYQYPEAPTHPHILRNIFPQRELPCIQYDYPWYRWVTSPHRLKTSLFNALGYTYERTYICAPATASMAGAEDVRESHRAIHGALRAGHEKLVLAGFSRGASATFTSMAQLVESARLHVRLVLLFAPFDSLDTLFQDRAWPWPLLAPALWLYRWAFTCDLQTPHFLTPLQAAAQFPLDTPVAFIVSEHDTAVPPVSTNRLIDALKDRGHPNLHVLRLKHETHATLADAPECQAFIEDLYQKYDL